MVVLKHAPNGDLFNRILIKPFTQPCARYVFKKILEGVIHLHSHDIIHLDLKPENLLFDEDFNIMIGDYGHSRQNSVNNSNNK